MKGEFSWIFGSGREFAEQEDRVDRSGVHGKGELFGGDDGTVGSAELEGGGILAHRQLQRS